MALPGKGSSPLGARVLASASQERARSTQKRRAVTIGTASNANPIHRSARGQRRQARASHTTVRWHNDEHVVHPREPSGVGAPGSLHPLSQSVDGRKALVMRGRHFPQMTDHRPIEHQPKLTSRPEQPQSSHKKA